MHVKTKELDDVESTRIEDRSRGIAADCDGFAVSHWLQR